MGQKIPIETSARHIHLSQEDFQILFGAEAQMHYTKELSQPGQYACQERLTVIGPKGSFEHVIVLGPYRSATQVEISVTDARKLGIPGVIRQSGDIAGTPGCILTGPCGQVELKKGVIVAKRHIHMTPSDAIRCYALLQFLCPGLQIVGTSSEQLQYYTAGILFVGKRIGLICVHMHGKAEIRADTHHYIRKNK